MGPRVLPSQRASILVIVAGSAAIAACTLLTSLDGLSTPTDPNAVLPDAGDGAAPGEGGPLPDGAVDAGPDAPKPECGAGCVVLATGQDTPTTIGLFAGSVYWTNTAVNGSVRGCELPECAKGVVDVVKSASRPQGLAFRGGDDIAFINGSNGGNARIEVVDVSDAVSGTSGTTPCTPSQGDAPSSLAYIGGTFFWAGTTPNAIRKDENCSSGGTTVVPQALVRAITTDGVELVWSTDDATNNGRIVRCPSAVTCPGAVTRLLGVGPVHEMALDAEAIYFTDGADNGRVLRARKETLDDDAGTAAPLALATGQAKPWGIAVFGPDLYFTTLGGDLKKMPAAGGPVVTLKTGLARPWGIAVDGSYLYVTESGAGRVLRLAR